MHAFSFTAVLVCVFGVLLFKGQPSEQFAVEVIQPEMVEGMQSDQHVSVIDKAVTPAACVGSLGSFNCIQIKGKCYCFVNLQLPWKRAFDFCKAAKKTLLSIETLAEQKSIGVPLVTAMLADPVASKIGVWLSGTYVPAMESFLWASSVKFFSYGNWMEGEPNSVGTTAQCVRIVPSLEGNWASLPCDQWLPFICQD